MNPTSTYASVRRAPSRHDRWDMLAAVAAVAVAALAVYGHLTKRKLMLDTAGGFPYVAWSGRSADMSTRQGLPPSAAKPSAPPPALASGVAEANAHWPQWRGPGGQGIVGSAGLPRTWNRTENVVWRTPLPGIGHSSPVIWGDHVFVSASANAGARKLLIRINRRTGAVERQVELPDDNPGPTHSKNSHACSTPVLAPNRVTVFFNNLGLVGFDFDLNEVWRHKVGTFTGSWGTAASPVLDRDAVILAVDDDNGSFVTAVRWADGSLKWKSKRDQDRSFASPLMLDVAGVRQAVVNGKGRVWSYHADTGDPLWLCDGMTEWVTPTVVAGNGFVYAVSGPKGPTIAVRPDGRGNVTATHLVWRQTRGAPYIPSPVLDGKRLHMVDDQGVSTVFDALDGRLIYQARLRGAFTASPIAADGCLWFLNEEGTTYVVRAGDTFEVLAANVLGERCLASPAVAAGRIFIRTDEALWCLGKP